MTASPHCRPRPASAARRRRGGQGAPARACTRVRLWVEGGGGSVRPPSRRLVPGAGTARPPPLGRQGAAPGDQRSPPTPPLPLPLGPKSGQRQTEETAAPHPPRRGCCTRGEGALRPRQAPPVNCLHAPTLPAADRRRTGGAQDGANGATPSEVGLGKAGARTRAGGFSPPPPPPPPH